MCTGGGVQGRALGDITTDVNNAAEPAAEPAAKKVRGKEAFLPREGRDRMEALWKALLQLTKQAAKLKLVAGCEMFTLVVSRVPNGAFDPGSVRVISTYGDNDWSLVKVVGEMLRKDAEGVGVVARQPQKAHRLALGRDDGQEKEAVEKMFSAFEQWGLIDAWSTVDDCLKRGTLTFGVLRDVFAGALKGALANLNRIGKAVEECKPPRTYAGPKVDASRISSGSGEEKKALDVLRCLQEATTASELLVAAAELKRSGLLEILISTLESPAPGPGAGAATGRPGPPAEETPPPCSSSSSSSSTTSSPPSSPPPPPPPTTSSRPRPRPPPSSPLAVGPTQAAPGVWLKRQKLTQNPPMARENSSGMIVKVPSKKSFPKKEISHAKTALLLAFSEGYPNLAQAPKLNTAGARIPTQAFKVQLLVHIRKAAAELDDESKKAKVFDFIQGSDETDMYTRVTRWLKKDLDQLDKI